MIFKSLLIADIQEKKARFVAFEKGLNVITSTENHVGKSSIIKSLYSTLGAEVKFDNKWEKDTKLTVVVLDVNGEEYRVVRFIRRFVIFKKNELLLLTESVTKELGPALGEIFNFSVYLAEKGNNKRVVQAPPAFLFMPYYIDQDTGWSDMYESFERMEQFSKDERAKAVFFHLGIFTKTRIEKQAEKDRLKEQNESLKESESRIHITVEALAEELNNIIPANNLEELELQLVPAKKEIQTLIQEIGGVRNKLQMLQTELQHHEYHLKLVRKQKQLNNPAEKTNFDFYICPRCGYMFDEAFNSFIRRNYNQSNEEYLAAQIQFIINKVNKEFQEQEKIYVALMEELHQKEVVYDENQESYKTYLRYKGLADTLLKYQVFLQNNQQEQDINDRNIDAINKDLRKIPGKKDVEKRYATHVKRNIILLDAWDQVYEGKIQLLKALKAQGSLTPKIILSQYIALFQTMNEIHSSAMRFPFVIDSPRSMEPSEASSQKILTMIAKATPLLPQIIVATVDYDAFNIEDKRMVHMIYLTEQFNVLNTDTFEERKEEIEGLYHLMANKLK